MNPTPTELIEHLRLAAELAGIALPEVVAPQGHHIVLRGLRLHYLDWGTAGCRPVLFLHGGALTCRTWDLVCLALRRDYRCLALDQRGHGDSEWSPTLDYDLETHAADLSAFVEALDLRGLILVGQSMGGINAMLYAARHPQAVAALVVVDTGPSIRREGAQRVAEFVLGAGEVESLEALVERAQAFNPRRDPRLLRRSLLHNLRKRPDGGWTWKYDRRHLSKEQFERLASRLAGLREEVSNIAAPTLVLRGADSDVFSDQDARELAQALPDGRWERVEAAGHTVQGDNPAGLAAALRRFFRDIGAEAPASLGEPGQS